MLSLPQLSLSCALLIAAVCLLRRLGKGLRLPAGLRPILWYLVLLRLLLPLPLPGWLSLGNAADGNAAATYDIGALGGWPMTNEDIAAVMNQAQAEPLTEPGSSQTVLHPNQPADFNLPDWGNFPWQLLWAAGFLACAAWLGLTYIRCWRLFRQARPLGEAEAALAEQWLADFGPLRRPVQVRLCPDINAPLTYGCLRPQILLPAGVDFCQRPALELALLHEFTHIRRWDAALKLLAAAALCVHWFNPAVWLFFRLFSQDMELACDAAALKWQNRRQPQISLESRQTYALALLDWEQRRTLGLFNSFGRNKNVMEERIVAIMNVKKVSVLSLLACGLVLALACGAVLATSPAQADNPAQPTTYANLTDDELLQFVLDVDYESLNDESLHQLYVETNRRHLAQQLAPYEELGLIWYFEDEDWDGLGLRMFYQGREARGVWDEPAGCWITEHAGVNFPPEAGELIAVYTDGRLSGLRFADAQEQEVWNKLRGQSGVNQAQEYEPFGLQINGDGHLVYEGQLVRYFWDGYEVDGGGGEALGRAIRLEYVNPVGHIDLRTRRQVIDNGDGSKNRMGPLLGLEVYEEPNFAAVVEPPAMKATYITQHGEGDGGAEDHDLTVAERLAAYKQYGLEYREVVTGRGTRRDVYLNGQRMLAFVDQKNNGSGESVFSVSSTEKEGAELVAQTMYDVRGNLLGLRAIPPEEVWGDAYTNPAKRSAIGFFPGFNEEGERVIYYSTDGSKTFRQLSKE